MASSPEIAPRLQNDAERRLGMPGGSEATVSLRTQIAVFCAVYSAGRPFRLRVWWQCPPGAGTPGGASCYVWLRVSRGMSTCALGLPQPVTGSHPGPAW